jgi:sec-independent protein translocase protein TatA
MGFSGISIWQLLIVLAIVIILFGTKKLTGLGTDLGSALKGFKQAIGDGESAVLSDNIQQKEANNNENLS